VAPLTALALFLVWSNSFVAISYLLGTEGAAAQMSWVTLAVGRFSVAGATCALYCALWRRAESARVLKLHWRRLLACGLLAVPVYNFGLYYAQANGVAPPIASLTTTLVPLFVMILSAVFLGERLNLKQIAGLLVAASGMYLVATARAESLELGYPLLLAIAALAPFSWSLVTVLSKPVAGRVSPVVWSFLSVSVGTAMVLPLLPGATWNDLMALDGGGWFALLYLAWPCVVFGFVVWTWLLRHLPASTVGFTVFLNPPLTTLSKWVLALTVPAVFTFTVVPREWLGGLVTLTGMALALGARPSAGGAGSAAPEAVGLTGVNRA
jgi:drug/metabolite transporter (DMT)-like permease